METGATKKRCVVTVGGERVLEHLPGAILPRDEVGGATLPGKPAKALEEPEK
jgi:hypothetical protein